MTALGHILIVDDDAPFIRIYREIFEGEGLVVTAAHSAAEAARVLESTGPELGVVLLDQQLQGPGGPDTSSISSSTSRASLRSPRRSS